MCLQLLRWRVVAALGKELPKCQLGRFMATLTDILTAVSLQPCFLR